MRASERKLTAAAWRASRSRHRVRIRLPEVFAGFARDATDVAVRYPAALVPQAWAAAAPLLCLRTVLRLGVVDGELRVEPIRDDLRLRRVSFRGARVDVP